MADAAHAPSAKRAKLAIGSREHFLSVYDELRRFLVEEVIPGYGLPAEAAQWNADMLDYNVPGTCRSLGYGGGGGVARDQRGAGPLDPAAPAHRHCHLAPMLTCPTYGPRRARGSPRASRRRPHTHAHERTWITHTIIPPSAPLPRASGGKLNRGLTVVHVLQSIRGDAITDAEAHSAAVLGWCIEWLQAFFLVADDVMDGSITRRGQPCWYKLPKVGMTAVNDGFLLQAHLFKILKKHFGGAPIYGALLELFNEVTWQTELGQLLDLTSQPPPAVGAIDLDRFTLDRYKSIVKYKTAYYSFYLPVACGFLLAGGHFASDAVLKAAEGILGACAARRSAERGAWRVRCHRGRRHPSWPPSLLPLPAPQWPWASIFKCRTTTSTRTRPQRCWGRLARTSR